MLCQIPVRRLASQQIFSALDSISLKHWSYVLICFYNTLELQEIQIQIQMNFFLGRDPGRLGPPQMLTPWLQTWFCSSHFRKNTFENRYEPITMI